jgi:pyruvate,water dikinase
VTSGFLERASDIFFLTRDDLIADPSTWRTRVARSLDRWGWARSIELPATASREAIELAISSTQGRSQALWDGHFRGIGLGTRRVIGEVVRAHSMRKLLKRRAWPESTVLVVEALEPSWAVVYSRCQAVVSELGGELSHAAILLREAGLPSVINARNVYHSLTDGDTVEVDPIGGLVTRIETVRHGPNGTENVDEHVG